MTEVAYELGSYLTDGNRIAVLDSVTRKRDGTVTYTLITPDGEETQVTGEDGVIALKYRELDFPTYLEMAADMVDFDDYDLGDQRKLDLCEAFAEYVRDYSKNDHLCHMANTIIDKVISG